MSHFLRMNPYKKPKTHTSYCSLDSHWQSQQSSQKQSRFQVGRCLSCGWFTFRLEERLPVTVKKESSRPCVLPCRLFRIFLQPFRILSSLQKESRTNLLLTHEREMSGFRATAVPPSGQTRPRQAVRDVPELLFVAHELDEPVLIGLAPLELQRGAVDHVRLQEQTSGFLVQPVLWRGVFLHDGGEKKIQSQTETSVRPPQRSGNLRTLRSMLSRISSMEPCCLMRSMARLGPIPLMVPQ